ncbi:MAG: nicotinate-nucleotide adenylyltransferase [Chromatiales bacterium]|nr:nicotinate-nucleotide adenylyltransferase [Chromatiales bacterium]
MQGPLGIAGGTFDPVHHGHLRLALELSTVAGLEEVRFVPAGEPPHRGRPRAPAGLRARLLEHALAGCPGFVLDRRELERQGPSYTVTTLESLREEFPGRPLCLLMGLDAFAGLASWHRWEALPGLAHLLVGLRPGAELPEAGPVAALLDARRVYDPAALRTAPAGHVLLHEVTQLAISSSAIRALVAKGGDPRFLVPDPVRALLIESGCYRPSAEAGGPRLEGKACG